MRCASRPAWLAACSLLLTAAPAARRRRRLPRQARFVGARSNPKGGRVDDPRLLRLVETRVGEPLSMARVRETIAHLFSLGQFEDVRVLRRRRAARRRAALRAGAAAADRGAFAFRATRRPASTRDGCAASITERYGASPRAGRARRDRAAVVEERAEATRLPPARGSTPRVDASSTTPDRGDAGLRRRPGDRGPASARSTSTAIAGMPDADLFDRLGVAPARPTSPSVLNERIDRYLDGPAPARILRGARDACASQLADDGSHGRPAPSRSMPGPHVSRRLHGDPLPADRREELVPIAREGSADEDLLEDSSNASRSTCARRATATPPRTLRPRGGGRRAARHLHGHGGPQYRVGARRLRRQQRRCRSTELQPRLRVRPGQPFSAAALDADRRRSSRTSIARRGFAAAQVEPTIEPAGCRPTPARGPGRGSTSRSRRTSRTHRRTRCASTGNRLGRSDAALTALGLQPGRPFFSDADGRRSRRDPAALRQPRLSKRDGRRAPRAERRRHARRRRLHGARGAADLRRPRAHRRQRAHEDRDHRARAAVQARRSARPRGDQREPAPAGRARVVPPGPHHRARARRRDHAATCS